MEAKEKCGILFDRDDFKDISGCLKLQGHLDDHICKTDNGSLMVWNYDFDCGCEDCLTDDINDMCRIYWKATGKELLINDLSTI